MELTMENKEDDTKILNLVHDPHCDVCGESVSDASFTVYKVLDTCPKCYDNIDPLIVNIADLLSISKEGEKDIKLKSLDTYSPEQHLQFLSGSFNILKTDPSLFQQFIMSQNCKILHSALMSLLLYKGMTTEK
jgi:hypothetical protein